MFKNRRNFKGHTFFTTYFLRFQKYFVSTTKTIYIDGHTETRYPHGRLRIKDKDGNLIIDRVVQN